MASLRARLRESSVAQWREREEQWGHYGLGDLGVSVSIKAVMLKRIAGRIDDALAGLRAELRDNEAEVLARADGDRAHRIEKDFLDLDVLIDLDAFIFESHSFLELLIDFLRIFYNNFLFEQFPVRTVRNLPEMLTSDDLDGTWVATLDKARSMFIHDEAPWLAVELRDGGIERWDIVVLRGRGTETPSADRRFHFDEFRAIYTGMTATASGIISRLVAKLDAAEQRMSEGH